MSQIAQALLKAKEHTGLTAAPFARKGQVPVPVVVPPQVKNTQRIWTISLSVVIILGVSTAWFSYRVNNAPEVTSEVNAPLANSALKEPANQADPAKVTGVMKPQTETQDLVNALVISAVMPGEVPRVMIQGSVFRAGQVVEGSLKFTGIKDDVMIFTDSNGVNYTRRY